VTEEPPDVEAIRDAVAGGLPDPRTALAQTMEAARAMVPKPHRCWCVIYHGSGTKRDSCPAMILSPDQAVCDSCEANHQTSAYRTAYPHERVTVERPPEPQVRKSVILSGDADGVMVRFTTET